MNFEKSAEFLAAMKSERDVDHFIRKIHRTFDYDYFVSNVDQPDKRNGDRIIDSIQNNGYNPIPAPVKIVKSADGEFAMLIDGHRRLDACIKLGLPFYYYYVLYDTDDSMIRTVNTTPVKWNAVGIARMYERQGREHYGTFLRLIEDYNVNQTTAMYIMTNSAGKVNFNKGIINALPFVDFDGVARFLSEITMDMPRLGNAIAQRAIVSVLYKSEMKEFLTIKNVLRKHIFLFPETQWSQAKYRETIIKLLNSEKA